MIKIPVLLAILAVSIGFSSAAWSDPEITGEHQPISWGDGTWQLQIHPVTGALVHIGNTNDPMQMSWLRDSGHWEKNHWIKDFPGADISSHWGLVETHQTGLFALAKIKRLSDRSWQCTYTAPTLKVTIRRELNEQGELIESYTFTNTGTQPITLPAGSVSITAPFFDQYPDTKTSLTQRCHAHIWMGGADSWVNATRMGATPPQLGLVLTQGSLVSYSQQGGTSNDRGVFLFHPDAMSISRGKSVTLAWKLFWHKGWDDFFPKLSNTPGFVRLAAKNYVITSGQKLEVSADSVGDLASAKMMANGKSVAVQGGGGHLTASISVNQLGDLEVALDQNGRRSVLRAFVIPPVDSLIEARLKFIIRKQQRNSPGDPLDGAYLAYDNETEEQVYNPSIPDHNAARERLGMGVLGAMYLPLCQNPALQTELKQSLQRYSDFLAREIEDEAGVVYEQIGKKKNARLYNAPWVADFHLRMYQATGVKDHLDRFVRIVRSYYASPQAQSFYPIGMPIVDGLQALKSAGRKADYQELLHLFRTHAERIISNGVIYPGSEVNFEQSIVAPGVQILSEVAYATGEDRYLKAASIQMPVLEAFAGRQPDSRLNEIPIRHWDDYWFGKIRTFGDTMPHYWSTASAIAYGYYVLATKDFSWLSRAESIVNGNLSLFSPGGAGSAAYLYALDSNGIVGKRNDPWANDQDWALVNYLKIRALRHAIDG